MRKIRAWMRLIGAMCLVVATAGTAARAQGPVVPVELVPGERIRIATWNLEWFFDADQTTIGTVNTERLAKEQSAPREADYRWRVEQIAKAVATVHPTVLALQEIEGDKVVKDLALRLQTEHGLRYKVAFVQGKDTNTEQDVAFLYEDRPGTATPARIDVAGHRFTDQNLYKMPSKHCCLRVSAKVGNTVRSLEIVNLHLKAGRKVSDEQQRIRQSRVVNHYAKTLAESGTAVVVLGDLNAGRPHGQSTKFDGVGVLSGLETEDPKDDLFDLHGDLAPHRRATHASGGQLDRIVVSPSLLDDEGLVYSSIHVRRDLAIRGQVDDGNMYDIPFSRRDLSDHFPLYADFEFRESRP